MDAIEQTWEDVKKISVGDIVRQQLDDMDVEQRIYHDDRAWEMLGPYHPDVYLLSYKLRADVGSSVGTAEVVSLDTLTHMKEDLVPILTELYDRVQNEYGIHPNHQTKIYAREIQDQIRYLIVRIDPDSPLQEQVIEGVVTKCEGEVVGVTVYSMSVSEYFDEPLSSGDCLNIAGNALHKFRKQGGEATFQEAIDAMQTAANLMADGLFRINVTRPVYRQVGARIRFLPNLSSIEKNRGSGMMVGYSGMVDVLAEDPQDEQKIMV